MIFFMIEFLSYAIPFFIFLKIAGIIPAMDLQSDQIGCQRRVASPPRNSPAPSEKIPKGHGTIPVNIIMKMNSPDSATAPMATKTQKTAITMHQRTM